MGINRDMAQRWADRGRKLRGELSDLDWQADILFRVAQEKRDEWRALREGGEVI